MHLTRQILSQAHSWDKEAPLSHAGLKRTHCLYCAKFWKTWSLILPPTWNIGTAQKHAWIRFIIAAHYFCWALHINCEWSDKITDDSKLNQPNCIWISVVPLNWVFYLIFASHCLPCALSLSLEHFLIYLNFLPYLSVCLSVHIFEANKAWCFRLEPNGWFCWVENDGLFPWSLSRQQIQQFLSEQGSVQQRGNSGCFVWCDCVCMFSACVCYGAFLPLLWGIFFPCGTGLVTTLNGKTWKQEKERRIERGEGRAGERGKERRGEERGGK